MCLIDVETSRCDPIEQCAAAEPSHHEIRGVGFPPVVIQRHDVWMLEAGDELGLDLETANEVGLVRPLGPDDLDGNLTSDRWLIPTVHDTEGTRADLLA